MPGDDPTIRVQLPRELHRRLKITAATDDTTIAALVRQTLEVEMNRRWPNGVPHG